jgi:hypothetical protein
MTRNQIILLASSVVVILLLLAGAMVRAHVHRSDTLGAPMSFALRLFLGVVFVILGIIGGLLPFLQGWVFMLLAVLVLFPQSKFAVKALDKIEPKMPRLVRWLHRIGIGIPKQ